MMKFNHGIVEIATPKPRLGSRTAGLRKKSMPIYNSIDVSRGHNRYSDNMDDYRTTVSLKPLK